MRVVFLTGSHIRHAYMARRAARNGCLSAIVVERREEQMPVPPAGLDESISIFFKRHFSERLLAEENFFGDASLPDVPVHNTTMHNLNGEATIKFVKSFAPDLILSYGIHKLSAEFLGSIDSPFKWNIHGGLSPWYRGAITHFWPSYFLEPQMTGMTVHELTDAIDGGGVIHQPAADLVRHDGLHDLACRAVISIGEVIPDLISLTGEGRLMPPQKQLTSGRVWTSGDWRPEHLRLIYDFYDNRIVDEYLNGTFQKKEPKLVTQF